MSTIPPVAKIRERIADWLRKGLETPAVPKLSPEQYAVSSWLSGQKEMADSLTSLLRARIESRGSLTIPSNSNDALVRVAMDTEARFIMSELTYLASHPVINPVGTENENE